MIDSLYDSIMQYERDVQSGTWLGGVFTRNLQRNPVQYPPCSLKHIAMFTYPTTEMKSWWKSDGRDTMIWFTTSNFRNIFSHENGN